MALVVAPFSTYFIETVGLDPESDFSWNDWGEVHARDLVADALFRAADGSLHIKPTKALRAYADENPAFRYAAYDEGWTAAPESSLELVNAIGASNNIRPFFLAFQIVGNQQLVGNLRKSRSPVGVTPIAVYGYAFHWFDLFALAGTYFTTANILGLSPIIFGAIFIAWLMVRGGLAPLHVAATKASRIGMDSLDQRISEADLPAEVLPFVQAVNQALARLKSGVDAQRRFTANAAHELRTPVAILRARIDHPQDATFLPDIKRDVRRIQTIVEQLLIAARVSNHDSPTNEELDLGKTILTMVADYMPLVIENRRRIEFEPPSTPVFVRGNRRALECVAANLIDNALRAEPEGGIVLVRVHSDGLIEVVDHGDGVAPDDRERIFEPFWRKNEATPGTGLGLAIAKELVELQGGKISIFETPGGGATFRISLQTRRSYRGASAAGNSIT